MISKIFVNKVTFFALFGVTLFACNANKATKLNYKTYVAYKGTDTATVVLYQSATLFNGILMINEHGLQIDSGDVKGVVKGDTLIGEYHYKHYNLEWKRKPFAMLVKNDRLIMGQGLMKLTVGIPHFNPTVPINFDEKKQFVFSLKH